MIRKPMMTVTLIAANQNSNSPKLLTFARFTTAKNTTKTRANNPLRDRRHPVIHDRRSPGDLGAQHHDQHEPVEPAHHEAGPLADPQARVVREGTAGRDRGAHLAEHAHHEHHDGARKDVGEIRTAGPALAIPTPVPRNRPAPMAEPQAHHRQMADLETVAESSGCSVGDVGATHQSLACKAAFSSTPVPFHGTDLDGTRDRVTTEEKV